jgi:hypothetical protein
VASNNVIDAATPMHHSRRSKGIVREPCYNVKEICSMYNLSHHSFAGLASQHPIKAALNTGNSGRGKAVYSKSIVLAWATSLRLERV